MELTGILKKEFEDFIRLKLLSELTLVKEKIKLFQKKYGMEFKEFERKVQEEKENFFRWDDYIEWKAHEERLKELEAILREYEQNS